MIYETAEEETDEEDTSAFVIEHRAKKYIKGAKHTAEEKKAKHIANKVKSFKGKRSAVEMDSDSDLAPADFPKKNLKKNEPKSINTRMSPRSLKKVLDSMTKPQVDEIEKMGFSGFYSNFNFDYTPSELGMWIVRNFDSKSCSIKMKDGRKLKITRQLVRDVLGIPMGDIKVESIEEINLLEETTVKWRKHLESVVVKGKIYISKLEEHLCGLAEVDWEFRVCFIVIFFSIFGQGNKDGEVNERIIPILSNTDNISQMDWCSYVVECMVKECSRFNPYSNFNGPLLLMAVSFLFLIISMMYYD